MRKLNDILILDEDDIYTDGVSTRIRTAMGGDRLLYKEKVVVLIKRDNNMLILKDHIGLSIKKIKQLINLVDEKLLLLN